MYILLNDKQIAINTLAECEAAGVLLDEMGVYSTPVFDEDGDTGMLVYSASARLERAIRND